MSTKSLTTQSKTLLTADNSLSARKDYIKDGDFLKIFGDLVEPSEYEKANQQYVDTRTYSQKLTQLQQAEQSQSTVLSDLANIGKTEQDADEVLDNRNWIQKLFNIDTNKGIIGQAFELLERPANAIKGAVVSMMGSNDYKGSLTDALLDGLTGAKEFNFEDLQLSQGMSTALKVPLSMGFEVLTDPLSYMNLPLKTLSNDWIKPMLTKAWGAIEKTLMKTEGGAQFVKQVTSLFGKLNDTIKSKFGLWKDKIYGTTSNELTRVDTNRAISTKVFNPDANGDHIQYKDGTIKHVDQVDLKGQDLKTHLKQNKAKLGTVSTQYIGSYTDVMNALKGMKENIDGLWNSVNQIAKENPEELEKVKKVFGLNDEMLSDKNKFSKQIDSWVSQLIEKEFPHGTTVGQMLEYTLSPEGWVETGLKGATKKSGELKNLKVFWKQDSGIALKKLMQTALERKGISFKDYGFKDWDDFLESLVDVQSVKNTDIPILLNRMTGSGVVDKATEDLIRNETQQGVVAKFKSMQQLNAEYGMDKFNIQKIMSEFKNKFDGTIQGKYANILANTTFAKHLNKAQVEVQYKYLQTMVTNNCIRVENGALKGTGMSLYQFARRLENSYNSVLPGKFRCLIRNVDGQTELRMLDEGTYKDVMNDYKQIAKIDNRIKVLEGKQADIVRIQSTIYKIGKDDIKNKEDILSDFFKNESKYLKDQNMHLQTTKLRDLLDRNEKFLKDIGYDKSVNNFGTYQYKAINRSTKWYDKTYNNVAPILKNSDVVGVNRELSNKVGLVWEDLGNSGMRAHIIVDAEHMTPLEKINFIGYLNQKGIFQAPDLPYYDVLKYADLVDEKKFKGILDQVEDRLFVNLSKTKNDALNSFVDFAESIPSGFSGQYTIDDIEKNLANHFEDIFSGKLNSIQTMDGLITNMQEEYAFNNIAKLYEGKNFAAYNKSLKNTQTIKRLTHQKNRELNRIQNQYAKELDELKNGAMPSLDPERQTLFAQIKSKAQLDAKSDSYDDWKDFAKKEITNRIVEQKNYIRQLNENYMYGNLKPYEVTGLEEGFNEMMKDPYVQQHWQKVMNFKPDTFERFSRYLLRNTAPGSHGDAIYEEFNIWKKQYKRVYESFNNHGDLTWRKLTPKEIRCMCYKKISQDFNSGIAEAENSLDQLKSLSDTIDTGKISKGLNDMKIALDRKIANSNALGLAEYEFTGAERVNQRLENLLGGKYASDMNKAKALAMNPEEKKQLTHFSKYYKDRKDALAEIKNQMNEDFDKEVQEHLNKLKAKNPNITKAELKKAQETYTKKNLNKFMEKEKKKIKKNGFERRVTNKDGSVTTQHYTFGKNKNPLLDDAGYIKTLNSVYDLGQYDVFQDALNSIFDDGWFGTDFTQALSRIGYSLARQTEILRRKSFNLIMGGWADMYNKSIKMISSKVTPGVLDQLTNKQLTNIVKDLVLQKQGIVVKSKAFFESNYGIKAEWTDIDGYLRHIQDTGEMFVNNVKGGAGLSGVAARTSYQVGGNKFKKANLARTKFGTINDINRTYGYDLFQTDPVTSIALGLEMTERESKLVHAFNTMRANGMIQTVTRQSLYDVGDDLARWRKIQEDVAKTGKSSIENWQELLKERDKYLNKFGDLDIMKYLKDKGLIDLENVSEWQIIDTKVYNTFRQVGDILTAANLKDATQNFEKFLDDLVEHSEEGGISIIHKSVPEIISRYSKPLQDANIKDILANIQRYFVKPWKGLATMSMGFHLRNILTNIMNANLAGFGSFDMTRETGKAFGEIQKLYGKNGIMKLINDDFVKNPQYWNTLDGQIVRINQLLDSKPEIRALWNDYMNMYEKGIIGNNMLKEDTLSFLQKIKADATRTPFYHPKYISSTKGTDKALAAYRKTYSRFSEFLMNMSKQTDDASKVAMYRLSKSAKYSHLKEVFGKDMTDERFVKFVLFDYADLTSFENNIMKTVFPFYTWAKKNLMFHLKNMMVNSKRYFRMYDLLQGWRNGLVESDEELSYMQNYMPIWRENGKVMYIKLTTPFMEMSNLLDGTDLVSMLNPIIKGPLEAITGFDFFTRKTINNPSLGIGLGFGGLFKTAGLAFSTLMGNYAPSYEDKQNAGIIGQKILGFADSISWLIGTNRQKRLGGQNEDIDTIANLFPSIFTTMDATSIKIQNIKARTQELQQALQYFQEYYGLGATPQTNTGLSTSQLLSYYK